MPYSTSEHDLYQKRYAKILKEGMDYKSQRDTFSRKFFDVQITTDKSVRDTSISSGQNLQRLAEGQNAPITRIQQGFISEIPWNRFGVATEVTFETIKTDDNNAVEDEANDQISRVLRTEDNYAGRIFRQAMNASYPIADGVPLVSASHPLRTGGTQSNTFSNYQKPLTYDSLLEARDIMNRLKDHSGNKISHGKKMTILIPDESSVMETAFQLAGVNGAMNKPGTMNNDKNFFQYMQGTKFNVVSTSALNLTAAQEIGETTTQYSDTAAQAYTNRWFLIDEELLMAKKFLAMPVLKGGDSLLKAIETESLTQKKMVYHFFGHGVRAGVCTWLVGSKGDNSATNF
jgi:hypothetical protein